MTDDLYATVDAYLEDLFDGEDPALAQTLERSAAAGLPAIAVSPTIGRLLQVLALGCGARSILEIGTLGGYSAIWLARALPAGGRVISLEVDPRHAAVARDNIDRAGVTDRVEVRVGNALDVLAELRHNRAGPFDMVFIDADKPRYTEYLQAALELVRTGAVIVADNVVRGGAVSRTGGDEAAEGARRFNAALAADPRVTAAFVQQVGVKGHDGMAIAVVTQPQPG